MILILFRHFQNPGNPSRGAMEHVVSVIKRTVGDDFDETIFCHGPLPNSYMTGKKLGMELDIPVEEWPCIRLHPNSEEFKEFMSEIAADVALGAEPTKAFVAIVHEPFLCQTIKGEVSFFDWMIRNGKLAAESVAEAGLPEDHFPHASPVVVDLSAGRVVGYFPYDN